MLYKTTPASRNPDITTIVRNPDITTTVELVAELRRQIKTTSKFLREIERDRYATNRDKRWATRRRHLLSGALALLRAGGRS